MTSRYLSIDLGAESGRVMLGTLEDGRIALEELSRFSNTPIRAGDRMYWNIPALLDGIRAGLASAGALGQAGLRRGGTTADQNQTDNNNYV